MSQTSYLEQAFAFAGMMADLTNMVKDTALNGETSAAIAFGKFTVLSAAELIDNAIVSGNSRGTPEIMKLPAAATDDFKGGGVVMHSHDYDKRLDMDAVGALLPKRQMSMCKKGRIVVNSGTAFAATDLVYIQYTAGIANVGDFANAADSGKNILFYGARCLTPIAAAGLMVLDFDMAAYRASAAAH